MLNSQQSNSRADSPLQTPSIISLAQELDKATSTLGVLADRLTGAADRIASRPPREVAGRQNVDVPAMPVAATLECRLRMALNAIHGETVRLQEIADRFDAAV